MQTIHYHKNISNNIETKKITIDYNIYNYHDVNYCNLIVNGNQTDKFTIEQDNQFIQDLNLGTYIIDINCFTDNNHHFLQEMGLFTN